MRAASSNVSPAAAATSTTAVVPLTAKDAGTGLPSGPVTQRPTFTNPAATAASTVPSPPSATGRQRTSTSGAASRRPRATAAATCGAVSEPLNLSGAMIT